jgi:hypothetical protein
MEENGERNQRIEPIRRSGIRFIPIAGAVDALLLIAHPSRSTI